jgi:hypothetical protein
MISSSRAPQYSTGQDTFGRFEEGGVAYLQDAAEEFGRVRIGLFDSCSVQPRQAELGRSH